MKTRKINPRLVISVESSRYTMQQEEDDLKSLHQELIMRQYLRGFSAYMEHDYLFVCESCNHEHEDKKMIMWCVSCNTEVCNWCHYCQESTWAPLCKECAEKEIY